MLVSGYSSSGDDRPEHAPDVQNGGDTERPSLAPYVATNGRQADQLVLKEASSSALSHNVEYSDLSKPSYGPQNPFNNKNLERKNLVTGYAEEQLFPEDTFNAQHRTFQSFGYAEDPSLKSTGAQKYVGNLARAQDESGELVDTMKRSKSQIMDLKRKREQFGDASIIEGEGSYQGPWAKYKREAVPVQPPSGSEYTSDFDDEADDAIQVKPSGTEPGAEKSKDEIQERNEKTTFHGSSMYDYQGRTYMHVPQDLDINLTKEPGEQECFVPKKCIHSWRAHPQGVAQVRFFPKSGHLLLSCGMDGKVKLWDCHHNRQLQRTYSGHQKTVKDICFSSDGRQFLSASYDKYMKLWDTETGQVISRFTTGKLPHCVKFNPQPEYQHEFLAGMSDKKIVQFDTRTSEITQEYDHHLGPINTITFVDENRRFMTTSDDKSLRVWEYGIPVPIKYIAEPHMHSMPSVALHPSGKYVAAQSLDNQIFVFQAEDKFRKHKRKVFKGHGCSGYGVEVNFSPDGRFLCSGDAGGYACFWEWKGGPMAKKFHAHDGPLISIAWHPQETSKVATAGLRDGITQWVVGRPLIDSGMIKYWD